MAAARWPPCGRWALLAVALLASVRHARTTGPGATPPFWPARPDVEAALRPWATRPPNGTAAEPSRKDAAAGSTAMRSGVPFLFRSASTGQRTVLCLNQKVSSTALKLLLARANPERASETAAAHASHVHRAAAEPIEALRAALADAAVPRFVVVRNPYSRLLSAYLDKVATGLFHAGSKLPSTFVPGSGFGGLVRSIVSARGTNPHFTLLSRRCGVAPSAARGVRYDYVLQIEQMALWYAPFVHALGLADAASADWRSAEAWPSALRAMAASAQRHGGGCFYTPPGTACEDALRIAGPRARTEPAAAAAGPPNRTTAAGMRTSVRGADAQLGDFYSAELAGLVTEWAAADLRMFGYPAWDGVSDPAAYIQGLRAGFEGGGGPPSGAAVSWR